MNVTVILCTYNRSHSLPAALESIAVSAMPQSVQWEVLVVDNNSKDDTRAVVQEFIRRYPGRFRYLFEPRQGKSYALNSGVQEAHGRILAFMDDDVMVDVNWLHNLVSALDHHDWAAGVGGRILPERDFTPPAWLSLENKYALAPLAIFDLGLQPGEMVEAPFGTNMAFRKEVFDKIGGFRTDLGPCPGSETRSEDTEFGFRALGAGQRLWYEPTAIVYHSLPPHRLQKQYFLAWWYDRARANIRVAGPSNAGAWQVAGVPLHVIRRLAVWTFKWTTSVKPDVRFSSKLKVWAKLGEMNEFHRLSSDSRRKAEERHA